MAVLIAAAPALGGAAGDGCDPAWLPTFGELPGAQNIVWAFTTYDDGTGPALIVGGQFSAVGSLIAHGIAKWNGKEWEPLGGGINGTVIALQVFDSGSGPMLYAGGQFSNAGGVPASNIARWDGVQWSAVGGGMPLGGSNVRAFAVHDEGSGPALFAGGSFLKAGSATVKNIAKWDGATWSPLDQGLGAPGTLWVDALASYAAPGKEAPRLIAGGSFLTTGSGAQARCIAAWDGVAWTELGGGVDNPTSNEFVDSLCVADDPVEGSVLYVGGGFQTAGGTPAKSIARWNGTSYAPLGAGVNGIVRDMVIHDDGMGGGPGLFVAGTFGSVGGVVAPRVAKWDGTSWSALGSGVGPDQQYGVMALASVNLEDSMQNGLWAGGSFTRSARQPLSDLARWDGAYWHAIGDGLDAIVTTFCRHDDGTGPSLFVAGGFRRGGEETLNRVGRWKDGQWSALGAGMGSGTVYALASASPGGTSTPALFAGGTFTVANGVAANGIAQWNGLLWSALGGGVSGTVYALVEFDDGRGGGPALYVGGEFETADGVVVNHVARWDGVSWTALAGGTNGAVQSLAVHDDGSGSGPMLYAGGAFTHAGEVDALHVARWNGVEWAPVGAGFDARVLSLESVQTPWSKTPTLYAGGDFHASGASAVNGAAQWDGAAWIQLGGGLDGPARSFEMHDDGRGEGPTLFVGGFFHSTPGTELDQLARWNGVEWSTAGADIGSGTVRALSSGADAGGGIPTLIVGGSFYSSVAGDSFMAMLYGCPRASTTEGDANGDGVVNGADVTAILGAWGPCEGCAADLNDDGVVDGGDVTVVLGNWT